MCSVGHPDHTYYCLRNDRAREANIAPAGKGKVQRDYGVPSDRVRDTIPHAGGARQPSS